MGEHHFNTPRERILKKRRVVTLILVREWLKSWHNNLKSSKLLDMNGQPIVSSWPELPGPKYLWPHDEYLNKVELREGNPPSDSDRPAWLRGIDLWLDAAKVIRMITEDVRDRLGPNGLYDDFTSKEANDFLDHYFGGDKDAVFH